MTVIAAFTYKDGLRDGAVDLAGPPPEEKGVFEWVGLFEPTPGEMAVYARRYHLHPLAVEDAMGTRQLPKVEVYGDLTFVVVRTATLSDGHIAYGLTAFFVGAHFILTVRHGGDHGHRGLRQLLEEAPRLLANGPDYVLHGVLDLIVDNHFPLLDEVSEKVSAFEEMALDGTLDRIATRDLFQLRRELLTLQRIQVPMEDVCAKLAHLDLPGIDPETRPYFRDVLDHVRRAGSLTALQRELLSSVMETSALIEQQQQNAVTRQLAAWAAILAVPTAIAGIYGMNFEHMPELKTYWGYPATIATIILICVLVWRRFRKLGWL